MRLSQSQHPGCSNPRSAIIDTSPFSGLSDWLLIRINQMSFVQLRLGVVGWTVVVVVVVLVVNLLVVSV